MSSTEYVRCEVTFKVKTDKAVLISFDNTEEWVPRSVLQWQCDMRIDELKKNEEFEIILFEWFADKIGLKY